MKPPLLIPKRPQTPTSMQDAVNAIAGASAGGQPPMNMPAQRPQRSPMPQADLSGVLAGMGAQAEDPLAKYSDLLARLGAGASKKPGQVSIMPVPKKPGMSPMPVSAPGRSWAEIVSEIMKGMK